MKSGAEARRTPCPKGGSQKKLPHVRGQGQWPRVPGCDGAGTAERSYPASQVRGGSLEELPHVQGQWRPGGATPRPRSGMAAGSRDPRIQGQGRPGEATSRPRPEAVTLRSHPEPEARGGSWEEPPMPEARAGGREEPPEEWWLRRRRRA